MPPVSPRVWSQWGRGHLLQRERQVQGLCPPRTTADGFPQYVVNYPQQTGTLPKVLVYNCANLPAPPLTHSLKSTTPEQSPWIFNKLQPLVAQSFNEFQPEVAQSFTKFQPEVAQSFTKFQPEVAQIFAKSQPQAVRPQGF